MKIAAGKRRHKVQFSKRVLQVNADGSRSESGITALSPTNVWAEIVQLSGRELEQAQQIKGEVTHRVTCIYFSGLQPKDYMTFGSRTFNIEWINNVEEANIQYEILCKEVI